MAGEDQYINPIIQAMLHTANIQADARSLAEKTRQSKAEEAFKQSQLQQQEGQFEKDLELRHRQADLYGQQIKSLLEHQHIENIKDLHGLGVAGVNIGAAMGQAGIGGETPQGSFAPQPQIPTITNPGASNDKVNIPGIGLVDPSAFGSPAQQSGIVFDQARAQAAGQAAGAAPKLEAQQAADFKRAMFMKQYDYERGVDIEKMKADAGHTDTQLRVNAELAAARIRASNNIQLDPDAVAQAYKGVLSGQTGFSTLPKEVKAGVLNLAGQRGTNLPTNQKQQNDYYDNIGRMEEMMNMYKDLALNFSSDGKDSHLIYRIPGIGKNIPTTDLKSRLDAAATLGGSLASFFDKQNRKSDQEISRQVKGLFDPNSSTEQNMQKINDHIKIINQNLKGIFSGMNPDDVKVILQDKGITSFMPETTFGPQGGSGSGVENWTRDSSGKLVKQ